MSGTPVDFFGRIRSIIFPATALIIASSSRLSYAIIAALDLVFVFALTFSAACIAQKIHDSRLAKNKLPFLPQKGKKLVLIVIANFAGCLFYVVYSLFNPFLALETLFITLYTPVFACFYVFGKKETGFEPLIKKRMFDALAAGCVILGFALVREPLGYAALSLPAPPGKSGIITLFNTQGAFPFPLEIISLSSGAFLLLGAAAVFYRAVSVNRGRDTNKESGEPL
jgi:hypothetical protein